MALRRSGVQSPSAPPAFAPDGASAGEPAKVRLERRLPAEALAKEGRLNYVYMLQSVDHPNEFYTGLRADVGARLKAHNSGRSSHSSKFKPWRLISAHYFVDPQVAVAFERFLKSGPCFCREAFMLYLASGVLPSALERRPRRSAQHHIADAIVEANPVDPIAAPSGVAVALLDAPRRGLGFVDIGQGPFHRLILLLDAALLPLAIQPDVERHRVMQRRGRGRRPGQSQQNCKERHPCHRASLSSPAPFRNRFFAVPQLAGRTPLTFRYPLEDRALYRRHAAHRPPSRRPAGARAVQCAALRADHQRDDPAPALTRMTKRRRLSAPPSVQQRTCRFRAGSKRC
jgi:putative endonuclease